MSRSSLLNFGFNVLRWLVTVALVFPALPAPVPVAQAAAPRYAKPAATNKGDCSSWTDACTLQTALTGATAGAEIWAASGVYTPGTASTATFQLKSGVAVYGGFAMTETLRSQRNFAANVTVLSGDIGTVGDNSDNAYHVVTGSGVDYTAVLDGFTVTGGNANSPLTPNDRGGGMYNNNGSPALTNVIFSGNATTYVGGGMYNTHSSPALTNVTFSGNSASSGGGMYNENSSPTLTNVTFSGNSASASGGGMLNIVSSPTLTNITFSGNSALVGGGMDNNNGSPTLTNVTFSGNSALLGGGIVNANGSNPRLRNTLLWGNTASNGAQVYNDNSTPVISDSIVQEGCPSNSTCTNIFTADPLLGTLGNYGGPSAGSGQAMLTFALLPGSSAINAGDDTVCPSTDQRGVARPQGTHCDIGAFEARGFTLTATSGDQQTARLYTAFAQPLSVTLNETGGSILAGATLLFTAPASGAGAYLSTATATTDSSGSAGVTATANGIIGSYLVTVTAPSLLTPATFVLTNTANTQVAVSASPNPSTVGQTVTFTATVSVAAPGSGTPSGSVAFKDKGTSISGCNAQTLNGSGQATCATLALAPGAHSVTAEYGGDGRYYNASTATYPQTVNLAPTTTTVTSSANPSTAGSAVMFTVTVTSPYSTPTGTVDLYEKATFGAQAVGAQAVGAQVLAGGVVTYTAAFPTAGTHTLLAIYNGDGNHSASTSAQYAQVVNTLSGPYTHWVYLPAVLTP